MARIYDILIDDFRPVTDADVKRFGALNAAWGRLREAGAIPQAERERLRAEFAQIDAAERGVSRELTADDMVASMIASLGAREAAARAHRPSEADLAWQKEWLKPLDPIKQQAVEEERRKLNAACDAVDLP